MSLKEQHAFMMTVYVLVVYFILTSKMVILPICISSSAGVAAAGEVAKDEKHLTAVEKVSFL